MITLLEIARTWKVRFIPGGTATVVFTRFVKGFRVPGEVVSTFDPVVLLRPAPEEIILIEVVDDTTLAITIPTRISTCLNRSYKKKREGDFEVEFELPRTPAAVADVLFRVNSRLPGLLRG